MFYLTPERALEYLQRRCVVEWRSLDEVALNCTGLSRRVVRVETGAGRVLYLKQVRAPSEDAEVEFYAAAMRKRSSWSLSPWLPSVIDVDRANGIVCLLSRSSGAAAPSIDSPPHVRVSELGEALARLHGMSPQSIPRRARSRLRLAQWPMRLHEDPRLWPSMSEGMREVAHSVAANSVLAEHLRETQRRLADGQPRVTHGDLRRQNLVDRIPPSADVTGRPMTLQIIDWETIGLGDPEWDLGSLVEALVRSDEGTAAHARIGGECGGPHAPPLPANVCALMQSYQQHCSGGRTIDAALVWGCAVGRVVQSAYEACSVTMGVGPGGARLLSLAEQLIRSGPGHAPPLGAKR